MESKVEREEREQEERRKELEKERIRQEEFKYDLIGLGSKITLFAFFVIIVVLSLSAWSRIFSTDSANGITPTAQSAFAVTRTESFKQKPMAQMSTSASPVDVLVPHIDSYTTTSSATLSQRPTSLAKASSTIKSGAVRQSGSIKEIPVENEVFELTYVVYQRGDSLGQILALFTLSPIFITVMFVTLCIFRRDVETVLAFVGQLLGVLTAVVAKKIINQPRPEGAQLTDSGMPSNHAQFIWYFAVFYAITFCQKRSRQVLPFSYCCLYVFYLMILAVTVSYSRYQNMLFARVFFLLIFCRFHSQSIPQLSHNRSSCSWWYSWIFCCSLMVQFFRQSAVPHLA